MTVVFAPPLYWTLLNIFSSSGICQYFFQGGWVELLFIFVRWLGFKGNRVLEFHFCQNSSLIYLIFYQCGKLKNERLLTVRVALVSQAEIIGVVSKLNCQTYKVAQFNRTNGMKLSQGGGQDVAVYSTNKGNMRKQFGNRNWKPDFWSPPSSLYITVTGLFKYGKISFNRKSKYWLIY